MADFHVVADLTSATGSDSTSTLDVEPNGDIFGAANNSIFEIGAGSTSLTIIESGVSGIGGLTHDADGNIYGTLQNSVYALVPYRGHYLYTTVASDSSGDYIFESGVHVGTDGSLNGFLLSSLPSDTGAGTAAYAIPPNGTQATITQNTNVYSGQGIQNTAPPAEYNGIYYDIGDGNRGSPAQIYAFDPSAQTVSAVYTIPFNTYGGGIRGGLVADGAGNLYGVAPGGSPGGYIFRFNIATQTLTPLAAFSSNNQSRGALLLDAAGNLFGTLYSGGANGLGEVFELKAGSSTITDLYDFTTASGGSPMAGLSADAAGNLYGVTSTGGANNDGTVFEIENSGYVACFCSGTFVRTARGDIAVEHLEVGDLAVTLSGARCPIRWLGHRTIDCRRHPRPVEALPIRIAAYAFGANRPARDLLVSPGHAICVDVCGEVLIPAVALVNGTTIRQLEVDHVTYWHVELDGHDILLAENLPAESYLDVGNRSFFVEEGVVSLASSPDAAARTYADFCRPFHSGGPLVDTVRLQLDRRAIAMGWTRHGMEPADKLELQSVEAA